MIPISEGVHRDTKPLADLHANPIDLKEVGVVEIYFELTCKKKSKENQHKVKKKRKRKKIYTPFIRK